MNRPTLLLLAAQLGVGVTLRAAAGASLYVEARAAIGVFGQASYGAVRSGVALGF